MRERRRRFESTAWRSAVFCGALFMLGGCSSEPVESDEDSAEARDTEEEEQTEPRAEDEQEGDLAPDADPEPEVEPDDEVSPPIDAGMPRADARAATPNTRDARVSDASTSEPRDASSARDAGADFAPDAAASEPDAATPSERMDLGKGDGRDVITIGDSWMRFLLTGIETGLVKASGQRYRQYGVLGTKLLDGVIPGQYRSAKRDDPDIKTVVMTGGGNDVIQSTLIEASCRDGTELCERQLNDIREALAALWAQMSKDGVQDVVHVMYSKSAASAVKNRDAHNAKVAETCAAVPPPLRCHMLNTDMLIRASDLRLDGIHPDDAGYDRIGKAVFDLMVEKGMRR